MKLRREYNKKVARDFGRHSTMELRSYVSTRFGELGHGRGRLVDAFREDFTRTSGVSGSAFDGYGAVQQMQKPLPAEGHRKMTYCDGGPSLAVRPADGDTKFQVICTTTATLQESDYLITKRKTMILAPVPAAPPRAR
ncbi:hypothetical protein EVAR_100785_1 [Eumeta japonica]|uniref:Uncharacterized protein n=1 Tax=Eumeta variegata TaxID=151549 RepID=A0A4C2AD73_EUMVA|nr:hypothetical protein EVAR_100785_1 [Eumeta japonica]